MFVGIKLKTFWYYDCLIILHRICVLAAESFHVFDTYHNGCGNLPYVQVKFTIIDIVSITLVPSGLKPKTPIYKIVIQSQPKQKPNKS